MDTVIPATRSTTSACPVCGTIATSAFLELDDVPAVSNRLYDSVAQAHAAPRCRIELAACAECSHVFNRAFRSASVRYQEGYENALHFSEHFGSYADALARDLVRRHQLRGKRIVEIGCGDGDFLQRLCAAGNNRGTGFDEALGTDRSDGPVALRAAPFSSARVDAEVDFVVCRHVLEHDPAPGALVGEVAACLGSRRGGGFYFEVPNGVWIVSTASGWDVIHEHVSYFTAKSLRRLFEDFGLPVTELRAAFGEQYLCIEGEVGSPPREPTEAVTANADHESFSREFRREVDHWRQRLSEWSAARERVVLWGAGSKGITFLNLVDPSCAIAAAVDVNPRKQGRYVPVTGHRVVAPGNLATAPPRWVIVLNPLYAEEIGAQIESLGLAATIVTAPL
jgi:SAM-dependent methyltransferase